MGGTNGRALLELPAAGGARVRDARDESLAAPALLRLLQLASPALPVGAFAFSGGLESAVTLGFVADEAGGRAWVEGTLEDGLARVDLPLLLRLYAAWGVRDAASATHWSQFLLACRESKERRLEDLHLGRALARLLADQGVRSADAWCGRDDVTWAAMFALGAREFEVPARAAMLGFAFSWAENQVGALSRLVPLGQLAAQRILAGVGAQIPSAIELASELSDGAIGSCLPGLALASALHETEYSRLFKS